jgi:hypothetical protein
MEVSPEVLAKQPLDIRLIVNDENERVQMRSPDLIRAAPARGRTMRTSVYSPGWLSISIEPGCCFTMMS